MYGLELADEQVLVGLELDQEANEGDQSGQGGSGHGKAVSRYFNLGGRSEVRLLAVVLFWHGVV